MIGNPKHIIVDGKKFEQHDLRLVYDAYEIQTYIELLGLKNVVIVEIGAGCGRLVAK